MHEMNVEINNDQNVALRSQFEVLPEDTNIRETPWLEHYLPYNYRGVRIPNQIIKARNWAIIALTINLAATIAGFSFYFMRRSRVYLVINTISLLIVLNGWYGTINLAKWNIAMHGVLTCSILGMFFLYSLLEAAIRKDLSEGGQLRYSERGTLLLLSLPYLIDFLAGCVTFYLAYLIFNEDERREAPQSQNNEANNAQSTFKIDPHYTENSDMCCICMSNLKNTVIYACGHRALCSECAEALKRSKNKNCPICRAPIKDIITLYS